MLKREGRSSTYR
jgi:hypothetical protein